MRKGSSILMAFSFLLGSVWVAHAQVAVWYPPGVKTLRSAKIDFDDQVEGGVITTMGDTKWGAAAAGWNAALVAVSRNFDVKTLPAQLKSLGEKSGHPELGNVPWFTHGMSWSSGRSYDLAKIFPERVVCVGVVCISIGGTPAITDTQLLRTPMVFVAGEGDYVESTVLPAFRARPLGAQWCAAVQWGQFHSFANSAQFLMGFYDQCLRLRIPADWSPLSGPPKLINLRESDGWLGFRDLSWKSKLPTIAPVSTNMRQTSNTIWFPNESVARLWRAFHASGPVMSISPPAEKYPATVAFTAPLKIGILCDGCTAERVDLYDGSVLLKSFPTNAYGLYQASFSKLASGFHIFTSSAISAGRETGISRLGIIGVKRDDNCGIVLDRPLDGSRVVQGTVIQVGAHVNGDKSPQQVVFYVDSMVLGTDNSIPYTASWTAPSGEGLYTIRAVRIDGAGDTTTSFKANVTVIGTPVATTIQITPGRGWALLPGKAQQFSAVVRDQYGYPMQSQPPVAWSVQGGGTFEMNGLFTAGSAKGTFAVTASASGLSSSATVQVSKTVRVNFGPSYATTPEGFVADRGLAYGVRDGGFTYGWIPGKQQESKTPRHNIFHRRYGDTIGVELATFIPMHAMFEPPYNKTYQDFTWEVEVPDGEYTVRVVMGDKDNLDIGVPGTLPWVAPDKHIYKVNAEDVLVVDGQPTKSGPWVSGKKNVRVSDGKLSISNATGQNWNKICFVEFGPASEFEPFTAVSSNTRLSAVGRDKQPRIVIRGERISVYLKTGESVRATLTDLTGRKLVEKQMRGAGMHHIGREQQGSGLQILHLKGVPGSTRVVRMVD